MLSLGVKKNEYNSNIVRTLFIDPTKVKIKKFNKKDQEKTYKAICSL
jgi:hypothetical protein